MRISNRIRIDRLLELLLLAAAVIGLRHRIPLFDRAALFGTFQDDAFYFFTIARNVAAGHGFTFDGIHATNGFQPLWLFLLVPLFRLVQDDVTALRIVAGLEVTFIAVAVRLLYRTLAPLVGRATAFAGALVLLAQPGSPETLRTGMESSVFLLVLLSVWSLFLDVKSSDDASVQRYALLGLLAALVALARLEAVVVLPLLLWFCRGRFRERPRTILALALPSAMILPAYFLWNRVEFGTWVPISGVVKQTLVEGLSLKDRLNLLLDVPWFGQWAFARLGGSPNVFSLPVAARALYVAVLCTLAALAWRFRTEIRSSLAAAGAPFLLVACLAVSAIDLLLLSWIQAWQRVPLLVALTLALVPLLQRSRRALFVVVPTCLALLLFPVAATRPRPGAAADCRVRVAEWLRRETRPDERIGSWNAGLIGYVSHRHVVNLDGLVNDLDYLGQVIVGRRFAGYLEREKIGWLADTGDEPGPTLRLYLRRVGAEQLEQRLELAEVFLDADDPSAKGAVWKLRSP